MNRSRSSSRALGRSHCKHLQERREGGKGVGMTPSHAASLRRVMGVYLRGEERVHSNGPPNSPLRSRSMLYPFNEVSHREKEIEKQGKKTKESPNSTMKVILALSSVMTNFKFGAEQNEKLIPSKSYIRKTDMYNGQRLTWLRIMTYLLHAKRTWS